MNTSAEFSKTFDGDQGLAIKRKLLVIVSLVLLSLSFSGAKIEEANTFIFKITFTHQNGLATLLVISIIFLMLRYYNYAKPYHDRLYAIWTQRLVQQSFFYSSNPYDNEDSGIVASSRSSELDAHFYHDVQRWEFQYVCGWPFTRYIEQCWGYHNTTDEDRFESVNIYQRFGLKVYLICLWLEAKEQIRSFFTHRENLDILSPYIIGWLAIASFYCSEHLSKLFEIITPNVVN